ncbi:MAG: tRNA (adenosine(37)-N6)-dimethylallyltransferase MiaA [Bacteroidia bacterium]
MAEPNLNNLIVVSGPTASGKTKLAANIAYNLGSEIISADSRQVYRNLDIGTGKDLNEYTINKKQIPYHLINVVDANEQYHLAKYLKDFNEVYFKINKTSIPILCGGTGLYIQSVLQNHQFANVPINNHLRLALGNKTLDELKDIFHEFPKNAYTSLVDLSTLKRAIRAIEICDFLNSNEFEFKPSNFNYLFFALNPSLELRRENIEKRLNQRLKNGLIEEVENLLKMGVSHDRLQFFGLEYKYLSKYLLNEIFFNELQQHLTIAIQQYAKRQMTFLRKMEKDGIKIIWLNPQNTLHENVEYCTDLIKKHFI